MKRPLFDSVGGPQLVTLLVLAYHRQTQEESPTANIFWLDQSRRLRQKSSWREGASRTLQGSADILRLVLLKPAYWLSEEMIGHGVRQLAGLRYFLYSLILRFYLYLKRFFLVTQFHFGSSFKMCFLKRLCTSSLLIYLLLILFIIRILIALIKSYLNLTLLSSWNISVI